MAFDFIFASIAGIIVGIIAHRMKSPLFVASFYHLVISIQNAVGHVNIPATEIFSIALILSNVICSIIKSIN